MSNLDDLSADIDARLAGVGLTRLTPDEFSDDRAIVWGGLYACLMVWTAEGDLVSAAQRGEGVLDTLLNKREKAWNWPATTVDGYLVLPTTKPPHVDTAIIRTIESSTLICRKFVIWHDGVRWVGLERIPILPLPPAEPSAATVEYNEAERQLLDTLRPPERAGS